MTYIQKLTMNSIHCLGLAAVLRDKKNERVVNENFSSARTPHHQFKTSWKTVGHIHRSLCLTHISLILNILQDEVQHRYCTNIAKDKTLPALRFVCRGQLTHRIKTSRLLPVVCSHVDSFVFLFSDLRYFYMTVKDILSALSLNNPHSTLSTLL